MLRETKFSAEFNSVIYRAVDRSRCALFHLPYTKSSQLLLSFSLSLSLFAYFC